jgi:3'(2'), 5'-bisphosphate nucleotidase
MQVYAQDFTARDKADASPVTEADTAAEAIIIEALQRHEPGCNIIAEEAVAEGATPTATARFYLVDPLDGTREFISRNGEFTVNIALIENRKPVAGVVYAPAVPMMYAGEAGRGAFAAPIAPAAESVEDARFQPIACPPLPPGGLKVVASRSHRDAETEAWLKARDIAETVAAGSSLKFCLLAEGKAHVYPRFGRTMEWDTAAGHAVLAAAGGSVYEASGAPLLYGKEQRGFDNPGFIASVSPDPVA